MTRTVTETRYNDKWSHADYSAVVIIRRQIKILFWWFTIKTVKIYNL